MQVFINGEITSVRDGISVELLLKQLEKDSKYLAVEINRELIPRKSHAEQILSDGDRVEIVTLVGGG